MSERILVPLDGSKTGETALDYLKASILKSEPKNLPEIILLYVIKPPIHHLPVEGGTVDFANGESQLGEQKKVALEYLEKVAEGLKGFGEKVSCNVIVSDPGISSAESIIKAETDFNISLVAMSTHGRRGLSRFAFGSVAEKVLRGGTVPVLVVRVKS